MLYECENIISWKDYIFISLKLMLTTHFESWLILSKITSKVAFFKILFYLKDTFQIRIVFLIYICISEDCAGSDGFILTSVKLYFNMHNWLFRHISMINMSLMILFSIFIVQFFFPKYLIFDTYMHWITVFYKFVCLLHREKRPVINHLAQVCSDCIFFFNFYY